MSLITFIPFFLQQEGIFVKKSEGASQGFVVIAYIIPKTNVMGEKVSISSIAVCNLYFENLISLGSRNLYSLRISSYTWGYPFSLGLNLDSWKHSLSQVYDVKEPPVLGHD